MGKFRQRLFNREGRVGYGPPCFECDAAGGFVPTLGLPSRVPMTPLPVGETAQK